MLTRNCIASAERTPDHDDRVLFRAAALIPAIDYIRASQRRRQLQITYAQAMAGVDVFVSPGVPLTRGPFGSYPTVQGREFTADDTMRYTFPFNLFGLPAITVPLRILQRRNACGYSVRRAGFR